MIAILLYIVALDLPLFFSRLKVCVPTNFSYMNYYIARLMRITASTSYCYDSAIFSRVNEDRSYVTWELEMKRKDCFILNHSQRLYLCISSTTTTTRRLSNITVQITFRNSSFIATTLTITKISLLVPVTVVCDGGTKKQLEYNEIPGNIAMSIFCFVLQLFLFLKPMLANVMPGEALLNILTEFIEHYY